MEHTAQSIKERLEELRDRRKFCKLYKSPANYLLIYNYVNKIGTKKMTREKVCRANYVFYRLQELEDLHMRIKLYKSLQNKILSE